MDELLSSNLTASVEQESVVEGEVAGGGTNSLVGAASAYLRSAMNQPVGWMEWGQAAFDRAAEEDKPILLDIGAVWCHWCHVMDRESYEDGTTAEIINEHFVAVKVDRDERPDVDTRYQAAVSAISGQGGWPLTAFLTPEGKPYFGGTYFPPEDRHGRPSFQRVLLTMAEAFENRRTEVDESAASVMDAIELNESFSGRAGNPGPELVEKMVLGALKSVDLRHGGFGGQPKFPHSSAVDLLIDVASRAATTTVKLNGQGALTVPEAARRGVLTTLDKMAKGGIYDHLAGGFHRYSVDEHWVVPHFEKMAYDNSELLKNYIHAYQTFGDEEFARVARDIVRWMDEWLSDRERGGFYASQDADFSLDDDGDYFTWTRDEAAEALTPEELSVASAYYDIGEIGDMQHNVAKNVLHVKRGLDWVARKAGVDMDAASTLLESAKTKLYAARRARPTPFVDKTMYVAWNALCISAYLEAGRVLGLPQARVFALRTLDRALTEAWDGRSLAHVVAYGEPGVTVERVSGVLDDYIFLGHAALDAWEATGDLRYYEAAVELTETAVEQFYDATGGGFFDTEKVSEGERRLGALVTRRKPLQDSPTPAGNPSGALLLMRMGELSGRLDYLEKAQETLETFAGVVEHFGLYAATYALALQRIVREPVQVCVIGEDDQAAALEKAALSRFAANKSVIRLRHVELGALPPVLEETLPKLPKIKGSFAVVCSGHTCQPPVKTTEELTEMLGRSL
ncbi:MAG TPA: thioredoxin domain-containing protein [Acidobacteriaceae bacterium]|jgi:hypothetical protein